MEAIEIEESVLAISTLDGEKTMDLVESETTVVGDDSLNSVQSNGVYDGAECSKHGPESASASDMPYVANTDPEHIAINDNAESRLPEELHSNDQVMLTSEDNKDATVNVDVTHVQTEVEITIAGSDKEILESNGGIVEQHSDQNDMTNPSVNQGDDVVPMENVIFETEVLVEKQDDKCDNGKAVDHRDTTNEILSHLEGQNIDLGEVLRSSDSVDGSENNNCMKQEVLNNEELLDILEGNDIKGGDEDGPQKCKEVVIPDTPEAQLAVQQITKLKRGRRSKARNKTQHFPVKTVKVKASVPKKELPESIVKVLEKDWDDEADENNSQDLLDAELSKTEQVLSQIVPKEPDCEDESSVESPLSQLSEGRRSQSPGLNKSSDEAHPHRRIGRVIKKKVIFDPDNPDTFTNTKSPKSKESQPEHPIKKIKTEQNSFRAKSKSPTTKTQWKKPTPKNSKQNRRLTEVDKLLMDEGAVNMIYQLTPEASKGRKNMRTKAELIKKINQSTTPDGKEMKFRERRKDSKSEEMEPKKILTGKHRPSLSGSVKSLAVDDFDTHTADDSIIYRRHSSSSYSSTCMSPRRLSDVEAGAQGNTKMPKQTDTPDVQGVPNAPERENRGEVSNAFMCENSDASGSEVINKKDCLTIKEKLNSKLSRALNIKRKRDTMKLDKPAKQKRSSVKVEEKVDFQHLSLVFSDNVAEINVHDAGQERIIYNIETLNELWKALELVDKKEDVSVTLLTSRCGNICAGLDFEPLLNENPDLRTNYAQALAESVRLLLNALERHSKVLATGAAASCEGLALAMLVLCDVAVASERATFALTSDRGAPLAPGVAALTAHSGLLPKSLADEMVVSGRQVSAAEALQKGLVSRTLWPDRFADQLRNIVRDIAAQPVQTLLLKKRLLTLKRSVESRSTFQSCLQSEKEILVQYWTSAEGQAAIRAHLAV